MQALFRSELTVLCIEIVLEGLSITPLIFWFLKFHKYLITSNYDISLNCSLLINTYPVFIDQTLLSFFERGR